MPAKKQINLFPKKRFAKTPFGKFLQWSLTYGRYIIIGTEIVVLLAFISRFKLDRDLTDLREEINQKQAIIESSRDFEIEIRTIQNRLSQISAYNKNQQKTITILTQAEKLTPTDVFFDSLSLDENIIRFSVNSLSPNGLTAFINNVRLSPYFTDVSVGSIQQKEGGGTAFTLTANIVNME